MFQHDAQHTGRSDARGPSRPVLKWGRAGGPQPGGALGPDGTYYFGAETEETPGALYAFDPAGKVKWRFPVDSPAEPGGGIEPGGIRSSPAVAADGTIYVTAGETLYAVTARGTEKWRFKTGVPRIWHSEWDEYVWITSSPVIALDGTIYFGSGEGTLYAVRPDGKRKWAFRTPGVIQSSPALGSDGTIYACSNILEGNRGGAIYALTPEGRQKWSYAPKPAAIAFSSPAVAGDGTIYLGIAAMDGSAWLLSLDPEGAKRWAIRRPKGESGTVALPSLGSDGRLYVWNRGLTYAMSSDGEVMWSYGRPSELYGGGPEFGPPTVDSDGTVYATTLTDSLTATLVALRPDGSLKWKLSGVPAGAPPVIGRDRSLYIGRVAVGER